MGFSRQEYWSGLPFPPPGDFPNPGIGMISLLILLPLIFHLQAHLLKNWWKTLFKMSITLNKVVLHYLQTKFQTPLIIRTSYSWSYLSSFITYNHLLEFWFSNTELLVIFYNFFSHACVFGPVVYLLGDFPSLTWLVFPFYLPSWTAICYSSSV